jgi:hypothetical protein
MTLLSLILNGVFPFVYLFHIVDEGLEGRELVYRSLWVLPFLINTAVLWKRIRSDGLKKRLIGTLPFIENVAVSLVSVVVRVLSSEMSGIQFVVISDVYHLGADHHGFERISTIDPILEH